MLQNKREKIEKDEKIKKLTAELSKLVSQVHGLYITYPLNDDECKLYNIRIVDKAKPNKFVQQNQEILRKCTLITQRTYFQNSLISTVLNNDRKQTELEDEAPMSLDFYCIDRFLFM